MDYISILDQNPDYDSPTELHTSFGEEVDRYDHWTCIENGDWNRKMGLQMVDHLSAVYKRLHVTSCIYFMKLLWFMSINVFEVYQACFSSFSHFIPAKDATKITYMLSTFTKICFGDG